MSADKAASTRKQLENDFLYFETLVKTSKVLGVPPFWILIALVSVLGIFVYFKFGPGLFVQFLTFGYPAYASFRALQSEDKEDDTQWLVYWCVFAFLSMFETFLTLIFSGPGYKVFEYLFTKEKLLGFRLGIQIWLFAPSTQGATFVYKTYLRPFLKRNEEKLDHFEEVIEDDATQVVGGFMKIRRNISHPDSVRSSVRVASDATSDALFTIKKKISQASSIIG